MMRHFTTSLLILTLAAFLIRGIIYVALGSWLPLAWIVAVLAILGTARVLGRRHGQIAVKAWGVFLILYGVFRIGLATLLYFLPINSPHAMHHTGLVFVVISALYLCAGVNLVIARRDNFRLARAT